MKNISKPNCYCNNCNKEFYSSDGTCPYCGNNKIIIDLSRSDGFVIGESTIIRKSPKVSKTWVSETFSGFSPSGDKTKHPKGVKKTRIIDKENNIYQEKIIDIETGIITRDIKEPLNEHRHK